MSVVEISDTQLSELIRVTIRNQRWRYLDMGVCIQEEGLEREITTIFKALNKDKEYSDYEVICDLELSFRIWQMKIVKNYEWRMVLTGF